MEDYLLGREGKPKFAIEPVIRTFLAQVLMQKDLKIDEHPYTYTITEIIGSLRGLHKHERFSRRILDLLLSTSTE